MNIIDQVGVPVWFYAKLFVLFGLGVYIVFVFVVLKQVRLMNETLEVGFERMIKFLAYGHMFLAILVFVLAIVIL